MTPSLFEQRRNHNLLKSFKLFFGQALRDTIFQISTVTVFDRQHIKLTQIKANPKGQYIVRN